MRGVTAMDVWNTAGQPAPARPRQAVQAWLFYAHEKSIACRERKPGLLGGRLSNRIAS